MTKNDLFAKINEMLPIEASEDFRSNLSSKLKEYQQMVKQTLDDEGVYNKNDIIDRLKKVCDAMKRCIKYAYDGRPHSAFSSLKNQLNGYETKKEGQIEGLTKDFIPTYNIDEGYNLYKMRAVEPKERKKLKNGDIFHIPLNKRGIVKTQRYSVPGLPCIYLGKSIYGCWEEMGRPDFGTIMASRFEVTETIKVLDLRIPDKKTWDQKWDKYILFMPIIIASMIQVNNTDDVFKPEYIVPQLLTEWVVSKEKREYSEGLKGIIYTSAMKSKDFDFPEEKYDNIAIPTIKYSDKKYCSVLTSIFMVTEPTYYNLECLKKTIQRPILPANPNKEDVYNSSDFAMMEQYLLRKNAEKVSS